MTTALMTSPDQQIELGGGIKLSATGAVIEGEPTLEQFWMGIQKVYGLANATAWALGDLLLYGEGRGDWGESYTQAVELTQKSYHTLTQAVRVSKAYPQTDREFARELSWTHHRLAAGVKDLDERRVLLQRCVTESLSGDDLRAIIPKQITESSTPETTTEGKTTDVTCPFCERSFVV